MVNVADLLNEGERQIKQQKAEEKLRKQEQESIRKQAKSQGLPSHFYKVVRTKEGEFKVESTRPEAFPTSALGDYSLQQPTKTEATSKGMVSGGGSVAFETRSGFLKLPVSDLSPSATPAKQPQQVEYEVTSGISLYNPKAKAWMFTMTSPTAPPERPEITEQRYKAQIMDFWMQPRTQEEKAIAVVGELKKSIAYPYSPSGTTLAMGELLKPAPPKYTSGGIIPAETPSFSIGELGRPSTPKELLGNIGKIATDPFGSITGKGKAVGKQLTLYAQPVTTGFKERWTRGSENYRSTMKNALIPIFGLEQFYTTPSQRTIEYYGGKEKIPPYAVYTKKFLAEGLKGATDVKLPLMYMGARIAPSLGARTGIAGALMRFQTKMPKTFKATGRLVSGLYAISVAQRSVLIGKPEKLAYIATSEFFPMRLGFKHGMEKIPTTPRLKFDVKTGVERTYRYGAPKGKITQFGTGAMMKKYPIGLVEQGQRTIVPQISVKGTITHPYAQPIKVTGLKVGRKWTILAKSQSMQTLYVQRGGWVTAEYYTGAGKALGIQKFRAGQDILSSIKGYAPALRAKESVLSIRDWESGKSYALYSASGRAYRRGIGITKSGGTTTITKARFGMSADAISSDIASAYVVKTKIGSEPVMVEWKPAKIGYAKQFWTAPTKAIDTFVDVKRTIPMRLWEKTPRIAGTLTTQTTAQLSVVIKSWKSSIFTMGKETPFFGGKGAGQQMPRGMDTDLKAFEQAWKVRKTGAPARFFSAEGTGMATSGTGMAQAFRTYLGAPKYVAPPEQYYSGQAGLPQQLISIQQMGKPEGKLSLALPTKEITLPRAQFNVRGLFGQFSTSVIEPIQSQIQPLKFKAVGLPRLKSESRVRARSVIEANIRNMTQNIQLSLTKNIVKTRVGTEVVPSVKAEAFVGTRTRVSTRTDVVQKSIIDDIITPSPTTYRPSFRFDFRVPTPTITPEAGMPKLIPYRATKKRRKRADYLGGLFKGEYFPDLTAILTHQRGFKPSKTSIKFGLPRPLLR